MAEVKNNNQKVPLILVPIAEGSEDLETVTIIDVLRRTEKVNLIVASIGDKDIITGSRGTKFCPDSKISKVSDLKFDLIAIPGGAKGAENCGQDQYLNQIIQNSLSDNSSTIVSAVCAAPAHVLASNKYLNNMKATCYPGDKFKDIFKKNNADWIDQQVVISKHAKNGNYIVTSQGPGTSMLFALSLVELLFDFETANKIAKGMLFHYPNDVIKKFSV